MPTLVVGCGMIGAHVAAELVNHHSEDVYLMGVHPDRAYLERLASFPPSHVIDQAVTTGEGLANMLAQYHITRVVVAAGSLHPAFVKKPGVAILNESRLMLSLCSAFLLRPVEKLVYISSLAVYGVSDQREEEPIPFPCSAYGITKFYNEQVLDFLTEQTKVETVVVRSAGVLGPNPERSGNWMSSVLRDIFESTAEIIVLPERFNRVAEYIDVRDLAGFIPKAFAQQAPYDVVNVSSGRLLSCVEFAEALEQVVGKTIRLDTQQAQIQIKSIPAMPVQKMKEKYNYYNRYHIINSLSYIRDFYVK